MADVGYINPKVRALYGKSYSELTAEEKRILHTDSIRRAKLIKEREEAVLKNNLTAFADEAKMEKVLASIYKDTQKQILADVAETMAKVKKAGGTWSYANQSALTRSRGLFEQITAELNKLGQKEQALFTQGLSNIYTDQFLRQIYELGQTIPVKANFNRLNPALIKKTLDYPWSGAMFSDRIWLDKETLGKNLRVGLTQSMILGEGIPEITDRINKGIDTSRYNAERLARTEVKRVTYVAHNDAYEDMGVDKLRYRVANGGDHRVCKVCMGDNDKEYERGKEPTLPRHPNCRCVYIPVVSDEFGENELNELTGSVRGAENYEKWRKNQEKSLKKSDDYDNDTIESLMKDLDEVEAQKKLFETKRNSAGAVIRGLDEPQDRGFKDITEAQKAKQDAEEKLKELEESQNKLYIKIEKKRKEVLNANPHPIPLTYTTQKGFNFSDGTGNISTKKIKDAVVATTMDGISIVTPAKVDSKKQLLTSQKISDLLDTLPLEIRQHCKEIQLVDYYNPKDSYWAKTYNIKKFYSYATGGNGKITFYRNDKSRGRTDTVDNSDSWVRTVMCHELGHSIDQLSASMLGKSTTLFGSDGADYMKAITEDFNVCKEMWVSDYGQSSNSVHEDFADSVAEFVINPLAFKKKFPNRYNYIEEVLNSL